MLAHARTSCVPHLSIESPTLILQVVKEAEARKLLMEFEDGEKKRYKMVTVLPNGEELVWDVPGNSTDVMQAYWSFSQATERMLQAAAGREVLQRRQLLAIAPIDAGPHGLQVVQIGTEKVMARLEINPPGEAEKKAAFAALSAAIEATAAQLPEQTYRQLYEKAKAAFNVCV